MQKLICDRCGLELTDKEDINLALEGKWAWEAQRVEHVVLNQGASYLARTMFVVVAR